MLRHNGNLRACVERFGDFNIPEPVGKQDMAGCMSLRAFTLLEGWLVDDLW